MRRAADLYLVGASIAGAGLVVGFTLASSTPPDWVLTIALVGILLALVAFLYASLGPQRDMSAARIDA